MQLSNDIVDNIINSCATRCSNDNHEYPPNAHWRRSYQEAWRRRAKERIELPDWVWSLPKQKPGKMSLSLGLALAEMTAFAVRCPDAREPFCIGRRPQHGRTMLVRGEGVSITFLSILLVFCLGGCMNTPVADPLDAWPTIDSVKADCAGRHYAQPYYNEARTRCENNGFKIAAAQKLSPDDYQHFERYLDIRLDIAQRLDRHVMTPQESDAALENAEWHLKNDGVDE